MPAPSDPAPREHDEEFMQFVRERQDALRRTAYLLCGSWATGDDLVQEALTRVYVAWPRISSPHAAFSYTRTTMLRAHLNERRKHGREVVVDDVPERPVVEGDLELGLTLEVLLAGLPDRQRTMLVLRFYDDLSVPQIARELGLPEGTVKSGLSRALAGLRGRLGPSPFEAPDEPSTTSAPDPLGPPPPAVTPPSPYDAPTASRPHPGEVTS